MNTYVADVVIFGGGIAGLWTLAQLRRLGYNAVLLESRSLGGVQTPCSQGIIHGGSKYALTGKATGASEAIGEMPGIWRDCLEGVGEIDLRNVQLLSEYQHLWSTESLLSKMTGFFAGKAMRSRMKSLKRIDYPEVFQDYDFKGSVYQLDEPVINISSLIQVLYKQLSDSCFLIEKDAIEFEPLDNGYQILLNHRRIRLDASHIVLTAGMGNIDMLKMLGRQEPEMQMRPLHMTMLQGDLPLLYAHCLGASSNPRLTITSYQHSPGNVVWYLGGQIAEEGVSRSREEQILASIKELGEVLPWVDLAHVEWATKRVNRAEIAQPKKKRPDLPYVGTDHKVTTVWPTKLAFAPMVATQVIDTLYREGLEPMHSSMHLMLDLPKPEMSLSPWEELPSWK